MYLYVNCIWTHLLGFTYGFPIEDAYGWYILWIQGNMLSDGFLRNSIFFHIDNVIHLGQNFLQVIISMSTSKPPVSSDVTRSRGCHQSHLHTTTRSCGRWSQLLTKWFSQLAMQDNALSCSVYCIVWSMVWYRCFSVVMYIQYSYMICHHSCASQTLVCHFVTVLHITSTWLWWT